MKHVDVRDALLQALDLAINAASVSDDDDPSTAAFKDHHWESVAGATDTFDVFVDGERWALKISKPHDQRRYYP